MNWISSAAIVAVTVLCTMFTRFLPFFVFGGKKKVPAPVQYLGKFLPPVIMGTLVVYCFKNVDFRSFPNGMAELLSVAVVAGLHLWKKNTLLSIGAGTVCYMVLIRTVFVS